MFWNKKSLAQLKDELKIVEAKIEGLEINSPQVKASMNIIDSIGKENKEEIIAELAKQDLPQLEEVGKVVAKDFMATAKLAKRKRKLEKKIAQLDK